MTQSVKDSARVEISFHPSTQPATVEAALRAMDGVTEVEFDASVRRLSVCFTPSKVDIPMLLGTVQPFGESIRVVAVITPCFHGFDFRHADGQRRGRQSL